MQKKNIFLSFFSLIFVLAFAQTVFSEEVPEKISVFSLGSLIASYECPMYNNYLSTKVVPMTGVFRKASLYSGTCKSPGEILKMKFKYRDRSRKFFNALHEKIAEQYDQKGVWEGDSFGILSVWKWHFIDKDGQSVSLAIEYNEKNTELSMGTVIKLAYPVRIEEEKLCIIKKNKIEVERKTLPDIEDLNWQELLPQ
ncbi:hypothetical protein [Desulfotalea psychrophila]|uniref:Uncharacterized protein n=1 Tax=Desulfotalea psychrophila (strain LSv54 / DSM 12343) TaxID=177439 RepID=Q6AMD8_DESPS|nr:hypothetical protein [Desulfotalea psychrophila]CAG36487.1 unknown protein [Desulfotalea psychrophila LSv54]